MRRLFVSCLLILSGVLAVCSESSALVSGGKTDKVEVSIITSTDKINVNQAIDVIVKFKMLNNWHIFAQNPGDIGRPTTVEWVLPEGYQVTNIRWSKPRDFIDEKITQYGYDNVAYYMASIIPAPRPEKNISMIAKISWLACHDECIPERIQRKLDFHVTGLNVMPSMEWLNESEAAERSLTTYSEVENSPEYNIMVIMLMAFLGGIVLNFMPCIFPILTIKAISLIQGSMNPREMKIESILYTIGVLISFLLMASVLVFLRMQGEHVGWGFQLQSPWFVAVMLIIFIIVFLMLLDLVSIRNPFANSVGRISLSKKKLNAFVTGFFAVLIASPCTAPFMGIAIGYTLTQPIYVYYPVFVALSLGYALPFASVGFFPRFLHRILPKPGKWMDVLKKIFAIPVFLTCAWLVWVLHSQTNTGHMEAVEQMQWEVYNQQMVEKLVADGKQPVFIDFTAKWCITCLANERMVLDSKTFADLVKKHNIRIFKADWTNDNPEITRALAAYGRNSIPLYVYYDGKSKNAKILPQLLTSGIIKDYLQ